MKPLRALGRFLGILTVGAGLALLQGLVVGPLLRDRHRIAKAIYKGINTLMNIQIDVKGDYDPARQSMVAANHMSYLDPSVLGSVFKGHFIGKREIGEWPVIGFLARQFDPILIRRTKNNNTHSHYKLVNALNEGKSILFFPESTTSDGSDLLPFKAGMFRVLFNQAVDRDGKQLTLIRDVGVQPVAIRVVEVNGRDARNDQSLRDTFAWHDNGGALQHMWKNALMADSMKIEVTILPRLDPKNFATPEDLANMAHKMVREVVTGQTLPDPEPFNRKAVRI